MNGDVRRFDYILKSVPQIQKKNQIISKTSRCVIICDLVSRKKYKHEIKQIFLKSVHINELSCMKIHTFQAKWRMLWPHSWYSLIKYAHIRHMRVSWNREQCCRRNFSFSFHEKIIFQFPSAKNGVFLWKENEKFLRQHCSQFQDTRLCSIRAYLSKLYHGCGHNIRHLALKSWIFIDDTSFLRTLS